MKRYESVADYIAGHPEYRAELVMLRDILQSTTLEEGVKWGAPIYTYEGKNVVGIGAFKSYVGLWFHQGALLKDHKKKLINAQENVTKALRQWRFENILEIEEGLILQYVAEAIENQKAGKEIKADRSKPLVVPPELEEALQNHDEAQRQFEAMTKGKKREYADYISAAKRAETKANRLEKILPMIAEGKGLNDRYR